MLTDYDPTASEKLISPEKVEKYLKSKKHILCNMFDWRTDRECHCDNSCNSDRMFIKRCKDVCNDKV